VPGGGSRSMYATALAHAGSRPAGPRDPTRTQTSALRPARLRLLPGSGGGRGVVLSVAPARMRAISPRTEWPHATNLDRRPSISPPPGSAGVPSRPSSFRTSAASRRSRLIRSRSARVNAGRVTVVGVRPAGTGRILSLVSLPSLAAYQSSPPCSWTVTAPSWPTNSSPRSRRRNSGGPHRFLMFSFADTEASSLTAPGGLSDWLNAASADRYVPQYSPHSFTATPRAARQPE